MIAPIEKPISKFSDDELMIAIQTGCEYAASELFGRHVGRLTAIVSSLCSNSPQVSAEEIATEALENVILRAKRYQPEGKFFSYLYKCARRLLIDSIRSSKGRVKLLPKFAEDSIPDRQQNTRVCYGLKC